MTKLIRLHGQRIAYRDVGSGPALLLIHGIAESGWIWDDVIPMLAREYRVIAPDLLGHGKSSKPRGDYSLGNQATLMRDLLVALNIESASLVGHSLGGGITMQFAYQYPERCERMVLIASGGLGDDVTFILRSLGLPGAGLVAPLVLSASVHNAMGRMGEWISRLGIRASPAQAALWRSLGALTHPATREAFVATVNAVVDHRGQRVSAIERLYLAEQLPTLLLWGDRDRIIPVDHARAAHKVMPHSRLEIIERAGHFLPVERAREVGYLTLEFLATTEAAHLSSGDYGSALRQRSTRGKTPLHTNAVAAKTPR